MNKIVYGFAFALAVIVGVASCSKEQSYNDASVRSSGLLEADITSNCTGYTMHGVYEKNKELTDSNYLQATVQVVKTGSYYIYSDTVNGFYFTGAGKFDVLGQHTIKLKAHGKPTQSGSQGFTLFYGNSICKTDIVTNGAAADASMYKFASSGCPQPTFAGPYKSGLAMDSSNTLTIDVDVTKAGDYTISTKLANGVVFSASGVFTATGVQAVTLKASGTPLKDGSFKIGLTAGTTCSFDLSFLPPAPVPDAAYSITCSTAKVNGTYMEKTALDAANTVVISANVSAVGKYSISSVAVNGISFSASGVFANTGNQNITLVGTGTPAAGGTFSYPLSGNGNSCSVDVIAQAAPVPAVFTLNGVPNACLTPVVNGTYDKGVALTSANTVVVKANVTTAGSYSVTTNTVNGMKFGASGTFTTTGVQDVTLTGSGTPVAAGVNSFTPQTATASCAFDITTTAPAVAPGIFTCKVDGVLTTFNVQAGFTHDADIILGVTLAMHGKELPPNGSWVPEMSMYISNNDQSYIKAGTYDEKHFVVANKGYRIEVDYKVVNADLSVTNWNTSSNLLTTNPPFTIVITSITDQRVKGTFSGKLTNINEGSNKTKTITEGVFDLPKE